MPYIFCRRVAVFLDTAPENSPKEPGHEHKKAGSTMGRLIKLVVVLALLGFIGLTGFAYLADLSPTQTEIRQPVTLDAD